MTERLYYDNAYLTEFDARVLACRQEGDKYWVLLDRSAFYPTSGGQPFDTGMLGGERVEDVQAEEGQVWHLLSEPLEVGASVHGMIDWPRRFDHMQQHAADHMIAGALHRLYGGVTIGLHISDEFSTIDVSMPGGAIRLTATQIGEIEGDVNAEIQRNVPIRCWFPGEEELPALPLRKPPTVQSHVRIVAIGEKEMVACGGTHPASAGQIGPVKILWTAPARGKMRLAFAAGMRAIQDYIRCFDAAHEAAALLSSTVEQLPGAVKALQEKLHGAEMMLTKLKTEQLLSQGTGFLEEAEILPCGERLVARFVEADAQQLRQLAAHLIRQPGVIALLGARNGDQALYVFGCAADVQQDMGKLLRDAALPLGGKGGGRQDFAQGGGSEMILAAACRILMNQ
ncbi:MAG: hypothetical protein E7324_00030 [Clostridiales bacterium]|nr:hypothetical protein [Clostridiales bacterium]